MDPVIKAFKQLAIEYHSRFNKAFGITENPF